VGAEVFEFGDRCSQGCVNAAVVYALVCGVASSSCSPDAFGGCGDPGLDGGDEVGELTVPAVGVEKEPQPPRPIGEGRETFPAHDAAGTQRHPSESRKRQVPLWGHRGGQVPVEETDELPLAQAALYGAASL
jgi:hypothetical protein